jgi:RNA polymerase sigma factor (TIGR02999 family)
MSSAIFSGERQAALDSLTPLLFEELHKIAGSYVRGERRPQTLQPTALVNEAYLRLSSWRNVEWRDRGQFLAAAATTMRRILVNHEEARRALKRGGRQPHQTIDEAEPAAPASPFGAVDLLAMDDLEARAVAMLYLKGNSLAKLYDTVMIPALSMAEQDRHKGGLDPQREEFVFLVDDEAFKNTSSSMELRNVRQK